MSFPPPVTRNEALSQAGAGAFWEPRSPPCRPGRALTRHPWPSQAVLAPPPAPARPDPVGTSPQLPSDRPADRPLFPGYQAATGSSCSFSLEHATRVPPRSGDAKDPLSSAPGTQQRPKQPSLCSSERSGTFQHV